MKKCYKGLFAAVIILTVVTCTNALAYPTFSDPKTGYNFFRVDVFCGVDSFESVSEFVNNNGLHLATRPELEALFANIGPYTKTMAENETGYAVATIWDDLNGRYDLGGWYDAGNGIFGIAQSYVEWWDGEEINHSWYISDPIQNAIMDPNIGLWAVSQHGAMHAPEPSTIILFGSGIIGIAFVRRFARS